MAEPKEQRSALWRRQEQLDRWHNSDTNREPVEQRSKTKVKFQDGCVFLAACSSGDKDEVDRLLTKKADINTSNIDGLTALHQACIDDNLEMVKFLIDHGADIDVCDNEGWTALHATASCGYVDVAEYLIEQNANIAAVNNDGELAFDLADGDDMENLLRDEMKRQGVDADAARSEEEDIMIADANQWINSEGAMEQFIHPKTGATPLHVAAAKGYIKVMNLLLEAGVDMEVRDLDGWTPVHAAAHWGQEEACKVLIENFCNLEAKNNAGQTVFDVADPDILKLLGELKEKQATLKKDRKDPGVIYSRAPPPFKRRSSVTRMSVDQKMSVPLKNVEEEGVALLQKRLKQKDEKEDKLSTSSGEETSSDSETEKKQNQKNKESIITAKKPQENGTVSEQPQVVSQNPKIEDTTTSSKKVPPPKAELTPGGAVEPSISTPQSPANKKQHNLPSAPESITTPTTTTTRKEEKTEDTKKDDRKTDDKKTDEREKVEKQEEKTDSSLPSGSLSKVERDDSTDSVFSSSEVDGSTSQASISALTPQVKGPLTRTASLPPRLSSFDQGVISTTTKPPTPTLPSAKADSEKIRDGPSTWRAGLRKTGSTSTVPETTLTRERSSTDRLARSASSPWLASNNNADDYLRSRIRPTSVSSVSDRGDANGDEVKNRFSDLYTKYLQNASGPGSSVSTGPTSVPSSSTTSSYQSTYVPYTRRRHLERENSTTTPSISTTTTTVATTTIRRSYEPPKRDEERETERKARAKRARETRRSTQGVTKEDIEMAEKTLHAASKSEDSDRLRSRVLMSDDSRSNKENQADDTSSVIRRRTWEDRKDDDLRSSYRRSRDSALSGTTATTTTADTTTPSISSYRRNTSLSDNTVPSSSTAISRTTSYRSRFLRDREDDHKEEKKDEDKDKDQKDKEEPSHKSSAIRARRKRNDRRPTGKITLEDIQGSKDEDNEKDKENKNEENKTESTTGSRYSRYTDSPLYDYDRYSGSGSNRTSTDRPSSYTPGSYSSSRYSSTATDSTNQGKDKDNVDYKKLYEEQKVECDKCKKEVRVLQAQLAEAKLDCERLRNQNDKTKSYDSTHDKREKRALERKLSEMEEELRTLESIRADNQRLKEENGALIRVISKLSK